MLKSLHIIIIIFLPIFASNAFSKTKLTNSKFRYTTVQSILTSNTLYIVIDKYKATLKYPKKYVRELILVNIKNSEKPKIVVKESIGSDCSQIHIIDSTLFLRCDNKLNTYNIQNQSLVYIKSVKINKLIEIGNSKDYLVLKKKNNRFNIYDKTYLPNLKKIRSINESGKYTFLNLNKNIFYAYYQPKGKNNFNETSSLALIDNSNIHLLKVTSKVKLKGVCCVFNFKINGKFGILHDFEMQKLFVFNFEKKVGKKIILTLRSGRFHSPKFFTMNNKLGFSMINTDSNDLTKMQIFSVEKNKVKILKKLSLPFGSSYRGTYSIRNSMIFFPNSNGELVIKDIK